MDGTPSRPLPHRERDRRRQLSRRVVAVAICAIACTAPALREVVTADDMAFRQQPPTLLVLFDGRVLYGKITECPGGYLIEQPTQKQVIPFEHIRIAASSLDEAYVKQRDGMNKPTAGDHLSLAHWCFELKLYEHATEQLTAALKLEPNRGEARALLQRVAQASPEAAGLAARAESVPQSGTNATTRTAAGIRPETQSEFVSRVQPILMNRCGNANCHGSASQNSLKLANVRTGRRQQRLETEANLAAVLKQLDRQQPEMSALLREPLNGENRSHRGLFTGPAGSAQLERIRAWVRQVSSELKTADSGPLWAGDDPANSDPISFGWDNSRPQQSPVAQAVLETATEVESPLMIPIPIATQSIERGSVTPAAATAVVPPQAAQQRSAMSQEERSAFLRNILEQDRDDAFSPDEFNRQVHGGGRSPTGR
ncbi:MAG: hypothetical protein JNG89_12665 [Planctomycetaceae bacterium]|nr:hypothetical protein [Planctomycetaceae bacterium]